jgi:hypothetical protein
MCARHMEDRLPISIPVVTHTRIYASHVTEQWLYGDGVLVEALGVLTEAVQTVQAK